MNFVPAQPIEVPDTREEELERMLSIIVTNAVIGPDAHMKGLTDCYQVPLDDIEAARALLSK